MMPPPSNNRKPLAANHLKLAAKLENLPHFITFVCEQARQLGFNAKRTQEIELVLEEALVNVIDYAYPTNQTGCLKLNLTSEAEIRP